MYRIFRLKRLIVVFFVLITSSFVGIQFIPTTRNESSEVSKTDISQVAEVPSDIRSILNNSCYDCHSNNTRYPWYSRIQPAAYFMERHIVDGKKELNFSEFGTYSRRRQKSKLRSIISQVNTEEMPLPSYTWIHWSAKLSEREKKLVEEWATRLRNEPVDSRE
ncbi:MAG: heme-binding domain-containing protein [Aridibacter famidurans]|nr:heme-binding domain-containing protein [Aridibacter famidurans]